MKSILLYARLSKDKHDNDELEKLCKLLLNYIQRCGGYAFPDGIHAENLKKYCEDGRLADVLEEYLSLDMEPLGDLLNLYNKTDYNKNGAFFEFAFPMGQAEMISGNCRKAFNSPFRPFVLMTTSIGSEGLDFHAYCDRMAHYTAPHNVVEWEQKNGRIDRRDSLAVRRHRRDAPNSAFDPLPAKLSSPVLELASYGLRPNWDPGQAGLHYYYFETEYTDEKKELDELFEKRGKFRKALGSQDDSTRLIHLFHLSPILREQDAQNGNTEQNSLQTPTE